MALSVATFSSVGDLPTKSLRTLKLDRVEGPGGRGGGWKGVGRDWGRGGLEGLEGGEGVEGGWRKVGRGWRDLKEVEVESHRASGGVWEAENHDWNKEENERNVNIYIYI